MLRPSLQMKKRSHGTKGSPHGGLRGVILKKKEEYGGASLEQRARKESPGTASGSLSWGEGKDWALVLKKRKVPKGKTEKRLDKESSKGKLMIGVRGCWEVSQKEAGSYPGGGGGEKMRRRTGKS